MEVAGDKAAIAFVLFFESFHWRLVSAFALGIMFASMRRFLPEMLAHRMATWLFAVVAIICAVLGFYIAVAPYRDFDGYFTELRRLTPISITVPVILAGMLSAVLVRRWGHHSKIFAGLVLFTLWCSILLYFTAMIFLYFTIESDEVVKCCLTR